ncbi:hypothetical protein A2609_02565 [Candidatus Kaiserbacteria bacterium RIFOXYD1_FULL_47_14]|uniref:Uncharacterized protein n=1 Tax=Candidatus Kaiserbacteria bacterium RIFOXYD1_FULL_47_14 TaxID=1798533 RepID=A0A1F6G4U5_9BACT|nr:MAG: hypothetical protein A2609_02565 [Candidatus Kaiserbacteria bacterium RIFOXYD1_FULL_47_14]
MAEIRVDFRYSDGDLVPKEILGAIISGCLQGLIRLGKLGDMIECFRITFVLLHSNLSKRAMLGPIFKVYFCDPVGKECWHEFDYRFVGSGNPNPSEVEIGDAIVSFLPSFITEHLKRCAETLNEARVKLDELTGEKPRNGMKLERIKIVED